MAKAKSNTPNWGAVKTMTENMAEKDSQRLEQKEVEPKFTLKLSQIIKREVDTRPLHLSHVAALTESLAILGLLEPLVVDNRSRLLAGGHRLAAITLLKEQNFQAYQTHFPNEVVQVRVMPFDAEIETDLALQVEVAENEHRRDYTPTEVRILAERLQQQGYKRLKGRPGKGEKSLVQALAFVINKSKRTVERYLQEEADNNTKGSPSHVVLSQEQAALKNTYKNLKSWEKTITSQPETPKRQSLLKKLPSMLRLIDAAIAEVEIIKSSDS